MSENRERRTEWLHLRIESVGKLAEMTVECGNDEVWLPVVTKSGEQFDFSFEKAEWERLKVYVDMALGNQK